MIHHTKNKKNIFTGTSGWSFQFWNDTALYSPGRKKIRGKAQLDRYASLLTSVELNASFYYTPKETTVKNWYQRLQNYPLSFKFAVKLNRYATHRKLLLDPKDWWPEFWTRMSLLKERLGPILIQLPPRFAFSKANLQRIYDLEHILPDHPFVFEFRNATWKPAHLKEVFQRNQWSVAVTHVNNGDGDRKWTRLDDGWNDMGINGRVLYVRLHGSTGQYVGGYTHTHLEKDIKSKISEGRLLNKPVYLFFNNTDSCEKYGPFSPSPCGLKGIVPSAIADALYFAKC